MPEIRHATWPVQRSFKTVSLGDSKTASECVFWAHGGRGGKTEYRVFSHVSWRR